MNEQDQVLAKSDQVKQLVELMQYQDGSIVVRRPIDCSLLADHLLIWRVDHISANAGRPVTPTKLLGLRHLGNSPRLCSPTPVSI